jgi:CubicO group peptidase (beta-lactamase class C family)
MINYKKPEECGISSGSIERFIKKLEDRHLYTHNLLIAKGDSIIYEQYWQPFNSSFLHRQYSVTKSITSLAVGFAEQDGLVRLDDPISKYFPEEAKGAKSELIKNQTVREMLMMTTSLIPGHWINDKCTDRVKYYFENSNLENKHPSGTIFAYDTTGSFILCAMVERVTGKRLMEYMREKCFDKIGVSPEATCLTCPGGHSWGDSALLCTARDLFRIARFTLNYGKWNGEQLLNEEYVRTATSKLVNNNHDFVYENHRCGYGYQFWRTYDDSFFFNGMGCQFAVCVPSKDLIMIYNGDNQGNDAYAQKNIIDGFFDIIVRADHDLSSAEENQKSLEAYSKTLKLAHVLGEKNSPIQDKIVGKVFRLEPNPMKIKWLKFVLDEASSYMEYENATGKKCLKFALGSNIFDYFPEEGYSDLVGAEFAPGNYYKMASSAAWIEPNVLGIHVMVVDKYLGRLAIIVNFKNENTVGIRMTSYAEGFLNDYTGFAEGCAE